MGLIPYADKRTKLTVCVAKLQYLDWTDFQRYVYAIGETRANLEHDPDYLQTFHKGHLSHSKTDTKKNAGYVHTNNLTGGHGCAHSLYSYRQRVLCYLLSHVNSCPLPSVKVALLRSLDSVSNEVKAQILMPTIEGLISERGVQDVAATKVYQDLTTYAVSAFDASATADINDQEKPAWALYEKVLLTSLRDGMAISIIWSARVSNEYNQVTGNGLAQHYSTACNTACLSSSLSSARCSFAKAYCVPQSRMRPR